MAAVFDTASVRRTPAEWALRYVWNEPGVSLLLSGMNAMEQVEENLRVAEEGLPDSLTAEELEIDRPGACGHGGARRRSTAPRATTASRAPRASTSPAASRR